MDSISNLWRTGYRKWLRIQRWRHFPSQESPADIASRGGDVVFSELWWNGPDCISDRERWPPQSAIQPSDKQGKQNEKLPRICLKTLTGCMFELRKALNICALVSRFVDNLRNPEQKVSGPVMSEEFQKQHLVLVKKAQQSCNFEDDYLRLNQPNSDGILECRGRLQGLCPVYIPDKHLYTKKLVHHEHLRTLHGGVGLTMTSVRNKYWVPRLRKLVKQTIRACHGCKRFQVVAATNPHLGTSPWTGPKEPTHSR